MTTKIALFGGKKIRKTLHENEWWFSVVDVVKVLTDSIDSGAYWRKLKQRLLEEGNETVTNCHDLNNEPVTNCHQLKMTYPDGDGFQLSTICRHLKLLAPDGKLRETDCANTEGIFRIIQSIPSPKAEPFKRWLAKVGYERVQEIENPELASNRTRAIYKSKGYTDDWIDKRIRGIAIREELTDEWKNRGAAFDDYEILTAEISKATFGVTPRSYKKMKGLKRENLRDHMNDFELIFNMLGERSTTEIHRSEDSHGIPKLQNDAKAGGDIAGGARKKLEQRIGRSIVSNENFLKYPQAHFLESKTPKQIKQRRKQ